MAQKIKIPVKIAARFSGEKWEAICLNFDIAVQGDTLSEVEELMDKSIIMYLQSFGEVSDPEVFRKAIHRPVPNRVAFRIHANVIAHAFMSFFGNMGKSEMSYSQYDQLCPT